MVSTAFVLAVMLAASATINVVVTAKQKILIKLTDWLTLQRGAKLYTKHSLLQTLLFRLLSKPD
jgi:hypothetical protein